MSRSGKAPLGVGVILLSPSFDGPAVRCTAGSGSLTVADGVFPCGGSCPPQGKRLIFSTLKPGRRTRRPGVPASSLAEREEGLRTSLEPHGCEVWSTDELRSAITPEGGTAAVGRLLDQGRLPDALIAYNDAVAQGIYDELRRRGLEPGRDIAVASFDDTRIAASQIPPLTSVAGFPQQIGAKGTELLMNRLADGNAEIQNQLALIEPQLKIRSSTATWRPRT
ncbi:substrate-binding domain-containing protein [Arthrobacter sp. NPDC056886]|uniref:substrate-binding domain-containing protein n=1 Tax=Arthrobacter sp. NPDC056886 TaxID=3345960 RepID=UPI00366F9A2A